MDFVTAVKTCVLEKYMDFNGRARRSEYWWFCLASFLVSIVIGSIPYVGFIAGLALLLPGLAVDVRRLHDVGKSGWYILFALIPLVGALYLLYLLIQDSEPGDNQYGPNPKF